METEIKLRVPDVATGKRLIEEKLGWPVHRARVFEANSVFDTPAGDLRREGKLLRLRLAGDRAVLTWKGPAVTGGPHKSRPETEVEVGSFDDCAKLLADLGYELVFRYDKYRTEYQDPATGGVATLDDTPIGAWLELEGEAEWIDRAAATLGFSPSDYVTSSYGALYLEYCQKNGIEPANMVFPQS